MANQQLQLLTAGDLAFSPGESRQLLDNALSGTSSAELVNRLQKRTQGWAAGLVLMLELARKQDGRIEVDPQPAGNIFDYFASELFDKADQDARQLLLAAAFATSFTAASAQDLSGQPQACGLLAELTRKNFFIVCRQGREPNYQYHPLFREFLMERARTQLDAGQLTQLQQQTARLLATAGQVEDAVPLFAATGDWPGLIPLVLSQAPVLVSQGRTRTLLEWIGAIPRAIAQSEPWLLFWSGVCNLTVDPATSRDLVDRAFCRFEARGDQAGVLRCWSVIVQTFMFELHDFNPLDAWIAWIDAHIAQGLHFSSADIEAGVVSGITGILAWRQPARDDRELWLEKAFGLPRHCANSDVCVRAYTNSALYYVWMGEFTRCKLLIEAMDAMLRSQPVSPLRLTTLHLVEAMLFNSSMEFGGRALEAVNADRSGVQIMASMLCHQGAVSALNAGNPAVARAFLRRAEHPLVPNRNVHFSQYFLLLAWPDLTVGAPPPAPWQPPARASA